MKKITEKIKFTIVLFVFSLFLAACSSSVEVGNDVRSEADQEESVFLSSGDDESEAAQLAYRFADREEGISFLLGNTEYYDNLNQNDMDYRVQKKGATLEEVQEFTAEQVLEFSEEEKQAIDKSMSTIESILRENGYVLPETDEIVFVRTTQLEECAANELMCHELFHCLAMIRSSGRLCTASSVLQCRTRILNWDRRFESLPTPIWM